MANAEKPKYENVSLEVAEQACKQAADAADEREEQAPEWTSVDKNPVQTLTEESFSKLVGQPFEIDHGGGTVTAKLAKVVHLGAAVDLGADSPGTQTQFSAVFEQSEVLPEGTYQVRHQELGEFHIHLQPVEPAGEENAPGSQLEAVFC